MGLIFNLNKDCPWLMATPDPVTQEENGFFYLYELRGLRWEFKETGSPKNDQVFSDQYL